MAADRSKSECTVSNLLAHNPPTRELHKTGDSQTSGKITRLLRDELGMGAEKSGPSA
jgi:hypothetical protein